MMRLIASCIWICLVTAASGYVSATWMFGPAETKQPDKSLDGLEHKTTTPINVPMIVNGTVEGYVVAQFVYLSDAQSLKQLSVPPDVFIADEAFRTLYSEQVDFNHLEKYDLSALTKTLVKKVNQRLGADIIKDMLIGEFNYVPKRDISK